MFRKFSAATALFCLGLTALTGCSGKLSTEETCDYLNQQIKEREINMKFETGDIKLAKGETGDYESALEEFDAMLKDTAGKTGDKQLQESLISAAGQSTSALKILADDSSDFEAQMESISELNTASQQQNTEYLGTACPNLDSVG